MRIALCCAAVLVIACSSQKSARPSGPPPEYERPVVMPWDSGAPVDPFEQMEGEEVTDDEPADAGAEAAAPADGALSPDPPTS